MCTPVHHYRVHVSVTPDPKIASLVNFVKRAMPWLPLEEGHTWWNFGMYRPLREGPRRCGGSIRVLSRAESVGIVGGGVSALKRRVTGWGGLGAVGRRELGDNDSRVWKPWCIPHVLGAKVRKRSVVRVERSLQRTPARGGGWHRRGKSRGGKPAVE